MFFLFFLVLSLVLTFALQQDEIPLRHNTSTRIFTTRGYVSPVKTLDLNYLASKHFFLLAKGSGNFASACVGVEFRFNLIACVGSRACVCDASENLSKREMIGDQTRSNMALWPNMLMLCWAVKQYRTCLNEQTLNNAWSKVDVVRILSNTVKQGVQRGKWLVTKQCWSPNISRLDSA